MFGVPTNEERVKELVGTLEQKLDVYDVILGKQKYLAGNVRCILFDDHRYAADLGVGAHSRRLLPSALWCHA
jgi:hypothetical protein